MSAVQNQKQNADKSMSPYISIIFANRNDEYTTDQNERITKFIEFYSHYNKKYSGLFEFIICDWNPPKERKPLRDAYPWDRLGNVIHLLVPNEIHSELCPDNSRPILDYIGRNACIRRASAPFVLVINQDIFLSSSILEFLSRKCLSQNYFYRADRCDFEFNYQDGFDQWDQFDQYAKERVINKHIRPLKITENMSPTINKETFDNIYTKKRHSEYKVGNIIYSDFYSYIRSSYGLFFRFVHLFKPSINEFYKRFFLHTNASGDFLIASKKAFHDVHGFVETHRFYMHLDSYMCVQLFAAGYKQAILTHNHTVFHSHHSRSVREGRPESMGYHEHAKIFSSICIGKSLYKINDASWGLRDLNITQF